MTAKSKLPAKMPGKKVLPTIIIEGHETFEKAGMTATVIDGVEHFLDRSYAENIGRIGYEIHHTIERNRLELEAYGTLRLVDGVFAVVGNGAKLPIKAYWLNADQMMILAMQSRTPKGVAFRKTLIELVKALREGRLVYRDDLSIASGPDQGAQTAHASPPNHALPFDLSAGLMPVPEVRDWAMSFSNATGTLGRSAKTDSGVTLYLADARTPCFLSADIALLVEGHDAFSIGQVLKANAETHPS
ncbi:MAG TPA: hypothetical protein VGV17_17030 [Bosea sp. (in: a-proteobacteria)]|jgi:hypothetical protein|uniref:hypothetical protein n=1 Tax=Bosea sp. (in: a-proteobacteria) TaxID=1871050 RepID=UPI002DDD7E82|nr:hypothetical protein [Bosea sp. (in: a-proteobacteria)]HEV2555460.1 hypothetical protein [Bosea sp. (in: a-proteobacteria)]